MQNERRDRGDEKVERRVGERRKGEERKVIQEKGGKKDKNCLILNLGMRQGLKMGKKEVIKANCTHYFFLKYFFFHREGVGK